MSAVNNYGDDWRRATHCSFDSTKGIVQIWVRNKYQNIEMVEYQLETAERVNQLVNEILQNTTAIFECLGRGITVWPNKISMGFAGESLREDFERVVSTLCPELQIENIGATSILSAQEIDTFNRAMSKLDEKYGGYLMQISNFSRTPNDQSEEESFCTMDRELPPPRMCQEFPSSFCATTVIKLDGTSERIPYPW
jgi:hypothetical protein